MFLLGFSEAVTVSIPLVAVFLGLNAVIIVAGLIEVITVPGALTAWTTAGTGLPGHDVDGLRVEAVPIGRGLGVAVSAGHSLAGRDEVSVGDLAGESWIVGVGEPGEPQFGPWPTLTEPPVAGAAQGWQARLGLVAAGIGITVVPGMAAGIVPAGVVWLPVTDPELVQRREALIVTAGTRSASTSAVVRALRAELTRYAPPESG